MKQTGQRDHMTGVHEAYENRSFFAIQLLLSSLKMHWSEWGYRHNAEGHFTQSERHVRDVNLQMTAQTAKSVECHWLLKFNQYKYVLSSRRKVITDVQSDGCGQTIMVDKKKYKCKKRRKESINNVYHIT